MDMVLASSVRKEWSMTCDKVIHEKPQFVKRTRDEFVMLNMPTLSSILDLASFSAAAYTEDDGSITLSLNELDIVENGKNFHDARIKLGQSILDYANEYYNNFEMYSAIPNRKAHIPYIMKALVLNDAEEIGRKVYCHDGQN